jgi:hypothetical protein
MARTPSPASCACECGHGVHRNINDRHVYQFREHRDSHDAAHIGARNRPSQAGDGKMSGQNHGLTPRLGYRNNWILSRPSRGVKRKPRRGWTRSSGA